MNDRILSSLEDDQPPADLAPPLQALWWLKKGDLRTGPEWKRATIGTAASANGDRRATSPMNGGTSSPR